MYIYAMRVGMQGMARQAHSRRDQMTSATSSATSDATRHFFRVYKSGTANHM